jgi:hypothetical protein
MIRIFVRCDQAVASKLTEKLYRLRISSPCFNEITLYVSVISNLIGLIIIPFRWLTAAL